MGKGTFTQRNKGTFTPLFVICITIVILLFIAAADGTNAVQITRY